MLLDLICIAYLLYWAVAKKKKKKIYIYIYIYILFTININQINVIDVENHFENIWTIQERFYDCLRISHKIRK